jgi:hypothetical protein
MTSDHAFPPRVLVDAERVSTSVKPESHVLWSELERVSVVNVVGTNGYSECFWVLSGGGKRVVTPVEIVMGAEDLNARLLALPGFDEEALRRARRAEARGQEGEWRCFPRDEPTRPWWKWWWGRL